MLAFLCKNLDYKPQSIILIIVEINDGQYIFHNVQVALHFYVPHFESIYNFSEGISSNRNLIINAYISPV